MIIDPPYSTPSTPPAWHWLHECDAPATEYGSIELLNLEPDPTYQGCWPSERYPSDAEPTCKVTAPADSFVVESCPECGTVTDIGYPESVLFPKRESDTVEETFSVPFKTQEFMFEELAPAMAEYLHDLLNDHMDLILEMARDRFRKGYCIYGSEMYDWSRERRLDETLQEIADAAVYLTSGPIEFE